MAFVFGFGFCLSGGFEGLSSGGGLCWGAEIAQVSERIRITAEQDAMVSRLLSFYGIGKWTALLIVSEIGEIGRFPSAKHLCSYAGLVPSVHLSGNTSYTGHIPKEGSKWL